MILRSCLGLIIAGSLLVTACDKGANSSAGSPNQASAAIDGAKYLLTREPESPVDILAARTSAKHGEPVVLIGRIGGSSKPWIDGLAAFTIVDRSLKACSDNPDDTCTVPWDYCCEPKESLSKATALVKVMDEHGQVVGVDARELLKVAELTTVVVKGKAQRDESGNLTVLAEGLYVRK